MVSKTIFFITLIFVAFLLSACGGGSGGAGITIQNPSVNPDPVTQYNTLDELKLRLNGCEDNVSVTGNIDVNLSCTNGIGNKVGFLTEENNAVNPYNLKPASPSGIGKVFIVSDESNETTLDELVNNANNVKGFVPFFNNVDFGTLKDGETSASTIKYTSPTPDQVTSDGCSVKKDGVYENHIDLDRNVSSATNGSFKLPDTVTSSLTNGYGDYVFNCTITDEEKSRDIEGQVKYINTNKAPEIEDVTDYTTNFKYMPDGTTLRDVSGNVEYKVKVTDDNDLSLPINGEFNDKFGTNSTTTPYTVQSGDTALHPIDFSNKGGLEAKITTTVTDPQNPDLKKTITLYGGEIDENDGPIAGNVNDYDGSTTTCTAPCTVYIKTPSGFTDPEGDKVNPDLEAYVNGNLMPFSLIEDFNQSIYVKAPSSGKFEIVGKDEFGKKGPVYEKTIIAK